MTNLFSIRKSKWLPASLGLGLSAALRLAQAGTIIFLALIGDSVFLSADGAPPEERYVEISGPSSGLQYIIINYNWESEEWRKSEYGNPSSPVIRRKEKWGTEQSYYWGGSWVQDVIIWDSWVGTYTVHSSSPVGAPAYCAVGSTYYEENIYRASDNYQWSGEILTGNTNTRFGFTIPSWAPPLQSDEEIVSVRIKGTNITTTSVSGNNLITFVSLETIYPDTLTWKWRGIDSRNYQLYRQSYPQRVNNPVLILTIRKKQPTDTEPPETTATISPEPKDGLNTTDVTVTLNAIDLPVTNPSGVKEIRYNLDNQGEEIASGSSVSVDVTGEGEHTLTFYAIDNATPPNTESAKSKTINIQYYDREIKDSSKPPPAVNSNPIADPLLSHSGEIDFSVTDLTIPGRGIPFSFGRTYRSQIEFNGPLGYNWDFNYNERLIEKPSDNKVIYLKGSARRDEFTKNQDGSYATPTGFYTRLSNQPDGSFLLEEQNGTKKVFGLSTLANHYTLNSIADHNGNQITFNYNAKGYLSGIVDTFGRTITVRWGVNNRISEIEDFSGRKVKYGYDDDYNLISVTSPATDEYPQGNTTGYAYSSGLEDKKLNHNLLGVTDPKGQAYLANYYNADDRVIRQEYGANDFQIDYLANPDDTFTTTVIDSKGDRWVYYHNQLGNAINEEITTAQGVIPKRSEYNAQGERTKAILPQGNTIEYVFDSANPNRLSQSNLLEVKRTDLSGKTIITGFTYEPRFNRVKTSTDAQGYTTTYFYDYEEASAGDMNGDGITIQQNGNVVKIVYPAVTLPNGSQQVIENKFWYNNLGQITREIDAEGIAAVYEYYTCGTATDRLAKVISDFGGLNITTQYEYDLVGNITGVIDAKGNKKTIEVNALNQVTKTISPQPFNYETRFYYDGNNNLERTEIQNIDENGAFDSNLPWITTSSTYDILDNIKTKTEQVSASESAVTQYFRDETGNLTETHQPEGNIRKTFYDELNRVHQTIAGFGSANPLISTNFYDDNNNLVRTEIGDGAKGTIVYQYDGFNRKTRVTDALGNYTVTDYDDNSNVTSVVRKDVSGVILSETNYFYDELNRMYRSVEKKFATTDYTDVTTTFWYDKKGRRWKTVDAKGNATITIFDNLDRVKSTTDVLGNKVEYTYDSNSNVTTVTGTEKDASGNIEIFVNTNDYDNLNRLIWTKDNLGNYIYYKYDSRNSNKWTKDRENNITRRTYDGLSRLREILYELTPSKTISVKYGLDKNGRLVTLTDDNNNATTYGYDAVNRRNLETLPDGSQKIYTFGQYGELSRMTDPNGNIVMPTYDSALRLIRKDITRATGIEGATFENLTYDGLSRMLSAQNDFSTVTMQYDSLGNLLTETQQIGSQSAKSVQSAYNELRFRTGLTYPSGKVVNFAPDGLNRISRIMNQESCIAEYQYTGPFRVKERSYNNNTKLSVTYDANRRVTGYSHTGLSAWLPKEKKDKGQGKGKGQEKDYAGIELRAITVGFAYGYDKEDNRSYEKRLHESGKGDAYTYDSIYRLVSAQYNLPDPTQTSATNNQPQSTQSWDLDGVGNWSTLTANGAETNYQVNPLNQYEQINGVTLTYDENGNCLFDGHNTLTYDYANRPVKIENKKYCVEFKYDALGRRIEKQVMKRGECDRDDDDEDVERSPAGSGINSVPSDDGKDDDEDCDDIEDAKIIRFYYDGARVIEECNDEGELKRSYIYGNGIDEIVVMQKGKKQYWYHENSLGSITHISNQKGEVIESYKYKVYGKATIYDGKGKERKKNRIKNRFMFTGREYDSETDLYYYRARYYSAELGRFLQRDPIQSANLYAYVLNNPLNYLDPFGLWDITRNSSMERGIAIAQGNDTFSELAKEVKLNPAEKNQWLYKMTGNTSTPATNDKPTPGERYEFPNVFYVTLGDSRVNYIENTSNNSGSGLVNLLLFPAVIVEGFFNMATEPIIRPIGWATYAGNIADEAEKHGYFVKNISTSNEMRNAFNDPSIWGFSFTGHGAAGRLSGANNDGDNRYVDAYTIKLNYDLGGVIINACHSAETPSWGPSLKEALIGDNPNAYPFKGHSGTLVPVFEQFYRWFD